MRNFFDCTLQFVELQLLQLVSLQAFILQLIDLLRGLFIQLKLLLQLLFHNLRGLPQRLYQIHVSVHIFEQQPALLLLDALLEVGHQLVDNIDVLLWELAVPAEVVDAEHIAFLFEGEIEVRLLDALLLLGLNLGVECFEFGV